MQYECLLLTGFIDIIETYCQMIYVVNSDIKNVIGVWDPNVLFKRPGPLSKAKNVENLKGETLLWKDLKINFKHIECVKVLCKYVTTEF